MSSSKKVLLGLKKRLRRFNEQLSRERILYKRIRRQSGFRLTPQWKKRYWYLAKAQGWQHKKLLSQVVRTQQTATKIGKRSLWEDYQEFQLGVLAGQVGYKSWDVEGVLKEYLENKKQERRLERQKDDAKGGIRRIVRVASKYQSREERLRRKSKIWLQRRVGGHKEKSLENFYGHLKGNSVRTYNRYRRLKQSWSKKGGLNGRCYITQTRNNIFVVLMCHRSGQVLLEQSAGKLGYKGAGKRTRLVAVQLGRKIGKESYLKNYKKITLYLRGRISMLVRGVVQGLCLEGVKVRRLVYVREIAHNGVRLRKSRRM